jgi:hypothetical protein
MRCNSDIYINVKYDAQCFDVPVLFLKHSQLFSCRKREGFESFLQIAVNTSYLKKETIGSDK